MWPALAVVLFAGQVALDAPSEPLAGRLVVRLLDEGFDVVPPDVAAPRRLIVSTSSATLRIEARGARRVRDEVKAHPAALAELELFQRAVLALRAAGTSTSVGEAVLVQVPALRSLGGEMQARVSKAVLESGFGMTETATRAAAVVCVETTPIAVGAARTQEDCVPSAVEASIAQAVRASVDRVLRPVSSRPQPAPPSAPPDPPWWSTIRAGVGGAGRAGAVDTAATAGFAVGRGIVGARIDASVLFASAEPVSALEVIAAAGPTLRPISGDGWRLEIGLRLGALLHRYDVEAFDSGLRVDFTADLPIDVAYDFGLLAVEIEVAPGLSTRNRRHEAGDEVLWSRGAARLMTTLGMSFDL